MGTTVTVALVDAAAGEVVFGHVGDSRAYRLRGGVLEQITTDHSLVAELVESGVLTPEEAETHPQRSAITRAVGTESAIEIDVFTVTAELEDLVLLCSDGLTDMLSEEEIASVLLDAEREPSRAAERLVAAANARGGEDNITVVLFELVEGEPDPITYDEDDAEPAELERARRAGVIRHGAGSGGRLASLALIAGIAVIAGLSLYWGISK